MPEFFSELFGFINYFRIHNLFLTRNGLTKMLKSDQTDILPKWLSLKSLAK